MLPHNVIPATSKKFICNDCNKIFNTKSHLTQHKKKKYLVLIVIYIQ